MNRFVKYIAIAALLVSSCKKDTIPYGEMSKIIADMYLADGYINTDYKKVLQADSAEVYKVVIKKYGYTPEQFTKTIDDLIERPGKLKIVYQRAKEILLLGQMEADRDMAVLPENSVSPEIMQIIYKIDRGIEITRYQRAMRWMAYPRSFIHWRATLSDSLQNQFEEPALAKWWVNSIPPKNHNYNINEKNSSSNFISN